MRGFLPTFIDDQFSKQRIQGDLNATVLFADLQGFTSHTELLMRQGKPGAERLSRLLNDVFGSAASAIHGRGGFIPYFAGDAFAGIFPHPIAPEEVVFAAEEIRQSLQRLQVEIPLRIGIDQGPVQWHITTESPHAWYIRGEGISRAVNVQAETPSGEIYLSPSVAADLQKAPGISLEPTQTYWKVLNIVLTPSTEIENTPAKHTASFLPTFLTQRFHQGEFRQVSSLFLAFPETLTIQEVDLVLQATTSEVYRREGYYKETDFTDKGGLIVAFFGAPMNTGESRRMVIQAALALIHNPSLANLPLQIGISTGPAFCGLAGNEYRQQYVIASRAVNLAARLAMQAIPGQILSDESTVMGLPVMAEALDPVRAKGFSQPIPVFAIHSFENQVNREEILYGRQADLEHMIRILDEPGGKCLEIIGEPGIGKTFMTQTVCRQTEDRIDWLNLHGNPANTAPFADLDQAWTEEISRHTRQDIVHLMDEILHLRDAEELSPRVRFERIEEGHQRLLSNGDRSKPLGILIEHWQDLDHATRKMILDRTESGQLIVLSTGRQPIPDFEGLNPDRHTSIQLEGLGLDGIETQAQTILEGQVSDTLIEVLQRAGNGNPFYSEQLLLYLRDNDLLYKQQEKWSVKDSELTLGGTLRDILVARLDRLEQGVREVLKSASVIGTSFDLPVLIHMMDAAGEHTEDVNTKLMDAERAEILKAMDELAYIFRHSLLREVIYDVQLDSRLQQLHEMVVIAMESVYKSEISTHYGAIAEHCEQAGLMDKAIHYLSEAGRFALRQYQNREALEYFDKAIILADPSITGQLILEQLPAYEALGQWQNALKTLEDTTLFPLENKPLYAALLAARGHFQVLLGQYKEAWTDLQEAILAFEKMKDQPGVTRCYRDLATLYFRQGDYQQAETYITRSMVMIDDPAKLDNQLVMSLALIRMNQGRYVEAEQLLYNDLLIRHQTGEKQSLISLYTNLGIVQNEMGHFDVALKNLERGLELAEQMGHRLWISIALGTRGLVKEQQGDWAGALVDFRNDLQLSRDLEDVQGESIALELLGSLLLRQGDWTSGEVNLQQSLILSKRIGYRKGQVKVLRSLAVGRQLQGQENEAVQLISDASALAVEMDNRKLMASCQLTEAWIRLEHGDVTKACEILSLAEEDVLQWDDPAMHRDVKILAARVLPLPERKQLLETFMQEGQDLELQAEATFLYALQTGSESDRQLAKARFDNMQTIQPKAMNVYRMNQLR